MDPEPEVNHETIRPVQRFSLLRLPEWLRSRFTSQQRFWFLCLLAGVLCGLAAVSFHLVIQFVFETLFSFAFSAPSVSSASPGELLRFAAIMISAPAIGGLIVGIMLNTFAKSATGSGIPQTKIAYYREFGLIRFRDAIYRFVMGTIFIGLGNSLGREGPTVHMCAAIASKIGQVFGQARSRIQAMVPVGIAAGVAAAFNAPLSAITFVFEELLDDFSVKALGGIVVAVVVAATIERVILGEHPTFNADWTHLETHWWMLVAIPLGLASAGIGHYFLSVLLSLRQQIRSWGGLPNWLKPAMGGLMVGLLGTCVFLLTGQNGVFSVGYGNLSLATEAGVAFWIFATLFVGKLAATTISYATGGSGGLFSPVLVIGGMLGAMFGVVWTMFGPMPDGVEATKIVSACTLLGMGTFFAAVIRCPITSILIIFEMTLNYSLVLPIMIGNVIAYYLARQLRPVPIYDALLLQDKINLRTMPSYQGKQDYHHLPISTILSYDVVTVAAEHTAAEALDSIETKHHAYPVVDKDDRLISCITNGELRRGKRDNPEATVAELMAERVLVTVTPETSIRDVANVLVVKDVLQVPVVSRQDETKLVGFVTLHDVARAQNSITETI